MKTYLCLISALCLSALSSPIFSQEAPVPIIQSGEPLLPGNVSLARYGPTKINIVLVTNNTVIAATIVSGRVGTELIALEAKSGAVRWRHHVTYEIQRLLVEDGRGVFFLITRDFLEKRTLRDNQLLWRIRLDTIPQQPVRRKTIREHIGGIAQGIRAVAQGSPPGAGVVVPAGFDYLDLILAGDFVVVTRMASSGGCGVVLFSDWLLLDQSSGQLRDGGDGGIWGQTERAVLMQSDVELKVISTGGQQTLKLLGITRQPLVFGRSIPAEERIRVSCGNRCLLALNEPFSGEVLLAEGNGARVRPIQIRPRNDCLNGWLLVDDHIVRFSKEPLPAGLVSPNVANPFRPWIEIFDLQGKLLHSETFPPAASGEPQGVVCHEKTATNVWLAIGETNVLMEFPSRAIRRESFRYHPPGDFRVGNIVYKTDNPFNVDSSSELQLQLSAIAIENEFGSIGNKGWSGRALWTHTERVTPRPRGNAEIR